MNPGIFLIQDNDELITRNPKFPLTALTNDTVEQFLKAVAWTTEEVKAAQGKDR